jgi:hypothetical protein
MAKFNLKQLKKDIKKQALKRRIDQRKPTKKTANAFPSLRKKRGGCGCGG